MNSLRIAAFAAALAAPAFGATAASAEDLDFTLENATDYHLVQLFISPSDVGDWEEDVLGSGVMDPWSSATVTIADGRDTCTYDIRMVFSDTDELYEMGVDLCSLGTYTVSQ